MLRPLLTSFFVVVMALSLVAPAVAADKPSKEALKKAKPHFKQGKAFYDAGEYDKAIEEYEKAYAIAPVSDLLFNIAQAYRLKGDKKQALEYYQKYLAEDPEGAGADQSRTYVAELTKQIREEEAAAAPPQKDVATRDVPEAEPGVPDAPPVGGGGGVGGGVGVERNPTVSVGDTAAPTGAKDWPLLLADRPLLVMPGMIQADGVFQVDLSADFEGDFMDVFMGARYGLSLGGRKAIVVGQVDYIVKPEARLNFVNLGAEVQLVEKNDWEATGGLYLNINRDAEMTGPDETSVAGTLKGDVRYDFGAGAVLGGVTLGTQAGIVRTAVVVSAGPRLSGLAEIGVGVPFEDSRTGGAATFFPAKLALSYAIDHQISAGLGFFLFDLNFPELRAGFLAVDFRR